MPRLLRNTLLSLRDLALTAGPFVVLAAALLAIAYWVLDPAPPRRVVLATGPEQSAYAEFGRRYADALRRHGITVELRASAGSRDNLRLLRSGAERVDLAFVQGGASEAVRSADEERGGLPIVSLGSLFYEPVWLFYRDAAGQRLGDDGLRHLAQLRGWRLGVGSTGSGTPGLMGKLLQANGLEREDVHGRNLDLTPAVVALLAGELDAGVFVSAPEAPMMQMLLQTPGLRLFEFVQAEAYARRFPFLSPVTLARGVADIARDVPARDVPLVAATTSLVAREGTHPALVQLFVQAAAQIHGGAGWIVRAGQFPRAQDAEFPLAREAERYYRSGPPLLQRHLPFWLANLVDRMWVVLVSIIAVLIPLSRVLPPLYEFRVRSRIFRWYRQLRELEDALTARERPAAALLDELEDLDARAARIVVPLSHTDELYALRSHIQLVRERLLAAR